MKSIKLGNAEHAERKRPFAAPIRLHLEFLVNVSAEAALLYARAFAEKQHATDDGWVGLFRHGVGYVVEVHEGGSGHGHYPVLANKLAAMADAADEALVSEVFALATGQAVLIELTGGGVNTLLLPREEEIGVTASAEASAEQLQPLHSSYLARAAKIGAWVAASSVAVLVLGLATHPEAARLSLPPAQSGPLAISSYAPQSAPADKLVAGLKFEKGVWTPAFTPDARPPISLLSRSDARE